MDNKEQEENISKLSIKDNLKKDDLLIDERTKESLDKFLNGNYSNVGVIGDLGVGKSSLISSYLKGSKKLQPVYISIPRFSIRGEKEIDKVQEAKEIRKIIVYLLLEALKEESTEISCPIKKIRYNMRLERIENRVNNCYSLVQGKKYTMVYSLILTGLIIFPFWIIIKSNNYITNYLLYKFVFMIAVGIIIYYIIKFILELEIKNFSVGKVKVEQKEENTFLDDDTNLILSLLNLYSTMTEKKLVLIIEDLDRYENDVIFEELYQISNIRKKIPFVYLIKNSQFNNECILKYFDGIVDLQSTKDILYLEDLMAKELKSEVHPNLVVTVAPYIKDIRTYNRIHNRYCLMKGNYEKVEEIDADVSNEIFTIAFLKELFYDEIQNESNKQTEFKKCLDIIFDEDKQREAYQSSVANKISLKEESIKKLEKEIEKYDEEHLRAENLDKESLKHLLIGHLYKNNKVINIESTGYYPYQFLNNPTLLQEKFDSLLEHFKIENFSSAGKIMEKKNELEAELNLLNTEFKRLKHDDFATLGNVDKIKLIRKYGKFENEKNEKNEKGETKPIKSEKVDLIVELICKSYLKSHWDIYLTPNDLKDEIEVSRKKIRYNLRRKNNLIETGNIIYKDDFDNNKGFIDRYDFTDFEFKKELINESLLLFLWTHNNDWGFDDKLRSINMCIKNNLDDEEVVNIIRSVIEEMIKLIEDSEDENEFIAKYDFLNYLTREFIEILIAISNNEDEELKKMIINILFYCRLKENIDILATRYVVNNIDVVETKRENMDDFIDSILDEKDIIDNLKEFIGKLESVNDIDFFKTYETRILDSDFYIENLDNILYLVENNIIFKKGMDYLKNNSIPNDKYNTISKYLDDNYNKLVEKKIYDFVIFSKFLRQISNLKKYETDEELLKVIINKDKFEINKSNISFLIENEYFNKAYEHFKTNNEEISEIYSKDEEFTEIFYKVLVEIEKEKQSELLEIWIPKDKSTLNNNLFEVLYDGEYYELFEEYIKFNANGFVEFLIKYKEEDKEEYIREILDYIVSNKFFDDNILKEVIDLEPLYLSKHYSEGINDYILENTRCGYDQIIKYLNESDRDNKKEYYLNLINLDINRFLGDVGLKELFEFPTSGVGSKVKGIKKQKLIIDTIDLSGEILEVCKKQRLISSYDEKGKVIKIKK